MKKFLLTFLILTLVSSFAYAGAPKVNWDKFSENLTTSLKSENKGVKLSAMQLIIQYSDDLDVTDGVYDVMREFRNNEDQKIRKLALITLYKMHDDWAIDFLKMQHKFEDNSEIKNTIEKIVSAHQSENKVKIAKIVNDTYLSLAL